MRTDKGKNKVCANIVLSGQITVNIGLGTDKEGLGL